MNTVYLNGRFQAPDEAQVSAFDRGFIFGDGIYEVLPVYGGRPFRWPHHLERLNNSLSAIGLGNPQAPAAWQALISELITREGGGDLSIYIQITRGPAPRDHAFPAHPAPTVFAYAQTLKDIPQETLRQGVTAVTLDDIRWSRCDIKAVALLANVLLRQEATEKGATEAILVRNGTVTEGSASNIFAVIDGKLVTAPKGRFILPGITRDLILELAQTHKVDWEERMLDSGELDHAQEVWMTSSTKEIMPIVRINGEPVGTGEAGPVFWRVWRLFQEYKQQFREGRAD